MKTKIILKRFSSLSLTSLASLSLNSLSSLSRRYKTLSVTHTHHDEHQQPDEAVTAGCERMCSSSQYVNTATSHPERCQNQTQVGHQYTEDHKNNAGGLKDINKKHKKLCPKTACDLISPEIFLNKLMKI